MMKGRYYLIYILIIVIIFNWGCASNQEGLNQIIFGGDKEDLSVEKYFSEIESSLLDGNYQAAQDKISSLGESKLDDDTQKQLNFYKTWILYKTANPSDVIYFVEKNPVTEEGRMVEFFAYWSRRYSEDIAKALQIAQSLGFISPSQDYTKMEKWGITAGNLHAMLAFCYYLKETDSDLQLARQHLERAKELNLIEKSYATQQIINSLDPLLP